MKKNKLVKPVIGIALSSIAVSLISLAIFARPSEGKVTFATYTNGDAATYYSSIDETKSGNDLLTDLRTLNLSKRKSTVGYSSMGTSPSGQFKYTDYDDKYVQYDSNGQPYGTRISSFYTYTSATSWNREHVWPNSHGGGSGGDAGTPYPDADIHMPRPTISSENSSRGNSFFVEGMNHSSNGWDPYTAGYSADSRGEAARITFYCTLVSSRLILAPNNTTPSGKDSVTGQSFGSGHTMGNLETLIKWNIDYPVNQREKNRNEGAEYLQGNRNAFVDHPEYACKIWGNVNSKIKQMCSNASWDTGSSVSITKQAANITVDDTTTISASSSDGSQITWTTSDATVVTVSKNTSSSGESVTLTGIGPGTATVTATATIDNVVKTATCAVTVSSSGGSGGGDTPVSGDYSIVPTDLANGSYPTTEKSYTAESGIKVTAYNTANFSSKVQFKKSGGYLYNNDSLDLKTLTLNGVSGSLTVYAGTTRNPSSNTISGSNGVYNLNGYKYFKIINNSGSVATCSSINIALDNSSGTEEKTLSSITLDDIVDEYNIGEEFEKPTVIAHYSDNSTEDVTHEATCTGYDMDTAGEYTVTVTYEGQTTTYDITVASPVTLSSIAVETAPTKVSYTVGESFDPTGLVIRRNYSDNTHDTYTYAGHEDEFSFSPSTSAYLTTSNTSVIISYGGKTTSQSITVKAPKTLSSISVATSPTKVSYTAGENFDPTGLVIRRNYSDYSYDTYTYLGHESEFTFSPALSTSLNTYNTSVTITYSGKSTSQSISVTAPVVTLSSISVSDQKTSFIVGDAFTFGGTVTAHYSNSTTDDVTEDAIFTGYNMSVAGNYTVTVSYTEGNTIKTTTYQITVKAQQSSVTSETIVMSEQGYTSGGEVTTANGEACTVTFAKNNGSNPPKYYDSGSAVRLYPNNSLTVSSELTIVKIVITFASGEGTNAITSNPSGYSNGTWTGSADSVTFTVGGTSNHRRIASIEITYEESGSVTPVTGITASVSKTYYVGDTISSEDITVVDSNNKNLSEFVFANDGYQFKYEDAVSGGSSTSKVFENAISYDAFTCSLTVQVQRKEYVTPSSGSDTFNASSFTEVTDSYTEGQTATVSGVSFVIDGYLFQGNKISLSSSKTSAPGMLKNTTPYPAGITNVTVTGASPDIQLSVDGSDNSWVDLSKIDTSTNYYYFKLFYKNTVQTSYTNISSFVVSHKGYETANNVSNFIMFEDTNNQCTTKLNTAINYLNALPSDELTSFSTSEDYVIAKARERVEAWARSQGKTISYNVNNVTLSANTNINGVALTSENTTLPLIIVALVALVSTMSVTTVIIIKKKRSHF